LTGRFFAPNVGIYLITGQIYCSSWASGTYWLLDRDYYAQLYPFAEVNTTGTGSLILPFSATIYMRAGTYFWIRLIGSNGNTKIQYGGDTSVPANCTYPNGGNTSSNMSIICLCPITNYWS